MTSLPGSNRMVLNRPSEKRPMTEATTMRSMRETWRPPRLREREGKPHPEHMSQEQRSKRPGQPSRRSNLLRKFPPRPQTLPRAPQNTTARSLCPAPFRRSFCLSAVLVAGSPAGAAPPPSPPPPTPPPPPSLPPRAAPGSESSASTGGPPVDMNRGPPPAARRVSRLSGLVSDDPPFRGVDDACSGVKTPLPRFRRAESPFCGWGTDAALKRCAVVVVVVVVETSRFAGAAAGPAGATNAVFVMERRTEQVHV